MPSCIGPRTAKLGNDILQQKGLAMDVKHFGSLKTPLLASAKSRKTRMITKRQLALSCLPPEVIRSAPDAVFFNDETAVLMYQSIEASLLVLYSASDRVPWSELQRFPAVRQSSFARVSDGVWISIVKY